MPKSNESINRELFDLLRSRGYEPTMLDTSGKEIPVPEEAEVFQFDFIKDGKNYGKVTASIDGLRKLIIYFGKDVADSEKESSHDEDISWYQLLNHLKRWAQSRQISFSTRYSNHLKHDMAKRDHMKKKENIAEGYYPMGRNKSYSDSVPAVKIVIEHTRNINEGEQRFRNIARIFVENVNGERFLIPTTKPGLARVYARHIAEGGTPYDERATHINSLCEEYEKMAGFVRATRNHQFNEGTTRLVQEGVNHYINLRETLSRMAGRRGYGAYFESWTPTLMENEGEDLTQLNELFVEETLDPRIENVLPILNRIHKQIDEMKEVDELAEWADSLTEAPGAETLSHNEKTEAGNLKALGLAEDEAEDADKKSKVPAFLRKKSGDPNWKTTTKDLEKAKEKNISGKEGLAALKQRTGIDESGQEVEESGLQAYLGNKNIEEGWNDRLDDPDDYEGYLERLRDLADYNRKRDIEDPPQKHKAPTDANRKKVDEVSPHDYDSDEDYYSAVRRSQLRKGPHPGDEDYELYAPADPIHHDDEEEFKEQGVAEGSDKLQGTPVVSLKDLDSKDTKKNRYGQTVPKKLKKDDSRVKFHKDEKQGVAEGSNEIDQQAHAIADKLTTGKNLEKLRGMAYDSTVYRALDRYFEKHNIPETIYNRVAKIVFQRINQQGVAEGDIDEGLADNLKKAAAAGILGLGLAAGGTQAVKDYNTSQDVRQTQQQAPTVKIGSKNFKVFSQDLASKGEYFARKVGSALKDKIIVTDGSGNQFYLGVSSNNGHNYRLLPTSQTNVNSPTATVGNKQMSVISPTDYEKGFGKQAVLDKILVKDNSGNSYYLQVTSNTGHNMWLVPVKNVKEGVAEGSDKLQGTPVVSLKDLDDKDTKKDKYGRTVPKKLQKDDPRVKFHKDEKQGVAEAGMPSSVIKSKQRYSQMTPAEFAQAHKDKSDDELISMAWRHGYGKGSKHYVDKRNKGKQGMAEGSDKLQGTPVVSLKDLDSKDTKKNKYGQTVPKKLKKDDPRVKFHKDEKQGVAEDLDANQKRVGQLGPTEKVKNNNIGKLVGANESLELNEMDKSQKSSDRGGESSGNPYAKGGKATPIKAKDAEKDAEEALNKSMDKAHKKDVKEGQEDLEAILRIIRK